MVCKSTQVFCFVISAMIFVFGGRDVEAGVVRNVPEYVTESSNDVYPFIDGLRIKTQRPAIDTSDLEENDTDGYPFIDGVRKIPGQFGLPEIDSNEGTFWGSGGEFPFKDGLRKTTNTPDEAENILDEEAAVGIDGEYPFKDGLRRRTKAPGEPLSIFVNEGTLWGSGGEFPFKDGLRRTTNAPDEAESILDEEAVVGIDGEYPFKDGLRRRTKAPGEPLSIFDDEAKVGNDGNFPSINTLRKRRSTTTTTTRKPRTTTRKPRTTTSTTNSTTTQPRVENFEKNIEEYPFINGLRRHSPIISESKSSEEFPDLIKDLPLIDKIHLCASGKFFPFIDCYRINSTKSILKTTSDDDSEEYPSFLNAIAGKNSHPIRKRSVGAVVDDTTFLDQRREITHSSSTAQSESYPFVNGSTFPSVPTVHEDLSPNKVHRFSLVKRSTYQTHPVPPYKFKIDFGERKQGDTILMENVYLKPLFGKLELNVRYPKENVENSCPINYILIRNSYDTGDIMDDDVSILNGGIGQTKAALRITSPNFYVYAYRVIIYGKCA